MSLVIASVNCGLTKTCGNQRCFWKWRDVHNLCPWYIDDDRWPKEAAANKKLHLDLVAKYGGEAIFPTFKAATGTNCINITCDGYVEPKKEEEAS